MKPTPTPDQLRPWPFHGYAPGGYLCTCRICSVSFQGDKRAMVCLSCAVVEAKKELAADLSAAPECWRESLEKIAAMRWHEDADLDDICTIADRALSAALSVPAAAVVGETVGDVAYNAGLEIRYAIAASGVDPIQHIPEVDAIIERRLAEARKAAFIEAAEIAGKLFTAEFTPQEPGFMRGIGYAAQTIFDDLRAKAEGQP